MTGMSQRASQMAETASARATVGRACSGMPSPSMSSTTTGLPLSAPCPALASNSARPIKPAAKPMIAAPKTMIGKGTLKKKMPTKATAASAIITWFLSAFADANHGFDHDREHSRLEAEEQRHDDRDIAPGGVDVAQHHDGDDAGNDKKPAGDDAAKRAMHQPADIGRELLCLRARQQHAIVESMQEPLFRDPALLLDQNAMHDRDLPSGTAEAQRRDAKPGPERLAQRDPVLRLHLFGDQDFSQCVPHCESARSSAHAYRRFFRKYS